jgi:hypothetical protein
MRHTNGTLARDIVLQLSALVVLFASLSSKSSPDKKNFNSAY